MHEVLVNRLGGLSLPRKSVVRLIDSLDMTLDVYPEHKQYNIIQEWTLLRRSRQKENSENASSEII